MTARLEFIWWLTETSRYLEEVYLVRTRKTRTSHGVIVRRWAEKQRPAIVSLVGEPQDALLELNSDIISEKDDVDKIIARLNKIYKKDELTEKYDALELFEKYKRQDNTTIRNFLTEFEKHFHKTRSYGTVMPDDLLA